MKTKILALLYFFFPLANHQLHDSQEHRRLTLGAFTPDSARASLIVEEFNGRGY